MKNKKILIISVVVLILLVVVIFVSMKKDGVQTDSISVSLENIEKIIDADLPEDDLLGEDTLDISTDNTDTKEGQDKVELKTKTINLGPDTISPALNNISLIMNDSTMDDISLDDF